MNGPTSLMARVESDTAETSTTPTWQDTVARHQNLVIDGAFRHLVEKMTVVIFTDLADDEFTPLYISPQIQQLLGYSQEEWVADPTLWKRSLHPDDHDRVIAAAHEEDLHLPFVCEYRMRARDGHFVWVREESVTIRDADGAPTLFQGVFIDITAQKLAEARLQEAEARYRLLAEQLPAILYITDAYDGMSLQYVSPQVEDVLGYSVEELLESPLLWLEAVHPDDRPIMDAGPVLPLAAGNRSSFEWRAYTREGRLVWFRNEALLIGDANGEPLHWQGLVTDITAQKEAEEQLRQLYDKYRHILDNAFDVIMTFDTVGRITYANRAFQYHTGYSGEEAIGMHVLDLVYVEDKLTVAARIDALLRGEKVGWDEPFRVTVRDGGVHWAESSPSIIEENGQIIGVQVVVRDVTVQQVREQQLVHRAYHDELTGLPNRSQFIERLEQYLQRPERRSETFAVLFIDLDNFKAVNDALGHAAGDCALVISATRMQDVLREHDIVARFGGDEFAILLTALDTLADAEVIAGRLIDALMDPIEIAGREFALTASIGITQPAGVSEPSEALLRRADMSMYESKMRGKNQYQVYENLTSTWPTFKPRQADPPTFDRPVIGLLRVTSNSQSD